MVFGQICFRVRFEPPLSNRDRRSRIRSGQTNQYFDIPTLRYSDIRSLRLFVFEDEDDDEDEYEKVQGNLHP
jgi:hypothetical protein